MEKQLWLIVVLLDAAVMWVNVFVVNFYEHFLLLHPIVLVHGHGCVDLRDKDLEIFEV
jgi:hypothetical protein